MKRTIFVVVNCFLTIALFAATDISKLDIPDSLKTNFNHSKTTESSVDAMNKIACYLTERNPIKASEISREALRISDSASYTSGLLDANNNLGSAFYRVGKYQQALTCYNEAQSQAEKSNNDTKLAAVQNNIALVYIATGEYEKALQYNYLSLGIRKKLNDNNATAISYNNIGLTYHAKGDYAQAKSFYDKAIEIKTDSNDKTGLSNTYSNFGQLFCEMYTDTSRWALDSAIYYFSRAYNGFNATGNKFGTAQALTNMGNIHALKNEPNKAIDAFRAALNIQKEIDDSAGIALSLYNMGHLHNKNADTKTAEEYLLKSMSICKTFHLANLLKDNMKELFSIYVTKGLKDKAIHTATDYISLSDSIQEQSRKILIENNKGKTDFQQFENLNLRKELAKSHTWFILLSAFSALISCLYIINILRKKHN